MRKGITEDSVAEPEMSFFGWNWTQSFGSAAAPNGRKRLKIFHLFIFQVLQVSALKFFYFLTLKIIALRYIQSTLITVYSPLFTHLSTLNPFKVCEKSPRAL